MARKTLAQRLRDNKQASKVMEESANKIKKLKLVNQENLSDLNDNLEDRRQDTRQDTRQDRRTDDRTLHRTDGRTDDRTLDRTDGHSTGQTTGRTTGHSTGQTTGHSIGQSEGHSTGQSKGQTVGHSIGQTSLDWMTKNQKIVLQFLMDIPERITKLTDISNTTQIPYESVRKAISKLVKTGFILDKKKYQNGNFQGLKYTLDENLCSNFAGHSIGHSIGQTTGHSEGQTIGHSIGRTLHRTDQNLNSLSSSSLLLKNKTTSKATEILETEMELGYWRQKNLSPKQFLSWLKLFNDDIDLLIESLSYCAFAMVDLNEEKEKPVRNVFSWFFKIVEKTGSYPKPKGYKSCRQKLIENKERILKEKKEEIERLEKLNKEESKLNQELEYQKMLQNKEGEDYKCCFNRLNDFTKKLPENHSVFRSLMKKAFDELHIVKQIREISKDNNEENQKLIEEYRKNFPELVEQLLG